MKRRMTYGQLLQETVGKISREKNKNRPNAPVGPDNLGTKLAWLESLRKKYGWK